MNRPWQIWTIFGVSLALALGAMAWISQLTLQLDRSEREARHRAILEENVRLALWRMDAALSPLVAAENGRPYFEYRSFYAPDRAYTHMFSELRPGEVLVPSPLLTERPPYVLLHFQIAPNGELVSPQVPTGNMRDLAESAYATSNTLRVSADRLEELSGLLDAQALRERLASSDGALVLGSGPASLGQPVAESDEAPQQRSSQSQMEQIRRRSANEQSMRVKQVISNVAAQTQQVKAWTVDTSGEPLRPFWLGELLLLARQMMANGEEYLQGCWLDWSGIERRLIGEIRDLLPEAELEPIRSAGSGGETRMLASVPVRLLPGALAGAVDEPVSLARVSLLIAWFGVVAAAVAIGVLLRGAVSLSERRAAFVSAVTHELRTPLTSLGMYAEMMRKDMVPTEEKRRRYLSTMSAEVHRLRHLVNNVLTFGRMERGAGTERQERVTLGELVDRIGGRLAERAEQADMRLAVHVDEALLGEHVKVDSAAIEQVLFNLVDNACKYAKCDEEGIIHWEVSLGGDRVRMRVRDHGHGIPQSDAKRIFKAFRKSATEAAHSAPGVGLGLCLSRRLARAMGGDLQLETYAPNGASFLLTLPTA